MSRSARPCANTLSSARVSRCRTPMRPTTPSFTPCGRFRTGHGPGKARSSEHEASTADPSGFERGRGQRPNRLLPVTFVLLTGATRGIGQAAAVELASQGVEVALVGRDAERVSDVASEARATGGGVPVHEHVANLMLMADVRALGDEVRASYQHIDVLANNAGAVFASRKETSEGFEQTFALNHLAPFLLTNLLRDRLAGGLVVTTASGAHKGGRLDLDDLQAERSY